jgi:F-type H+-transporting ATPase subunit delta
LSLATIARRYALALADVATERREAPLIQEELSKWQIMIDGNPLLREVLSNPTVAYDQKRKILNELIAKTRVRETTANFLRVLLRNQRITELGEINKKFAHILDDRSGVVAAQVTTARPISEESKAALEKKLTEITGRRVRFMFATDEELIGGLVARIGSTIYDGSVRNQLQEVERRLAGI